MDYSSLEEDHPDIFENGATAEMCGAYDRAVEASGGRLPWTGESPGAAECREFGWYSKWVEGSGWVRCDRDDPGAGEDLNRLAAEATWSREKRRWVLA